MRPRFERLHLLTASAIALFAITVGCGKKAPVPAEDYEDSTARAERLAQEILIIDSHIDLPFRLETARENISEPTANGDFDYPRARRGGLDAAFMSIYIPSDLQRTGGAAAKAEELIDRVESFVEQWPDHFALARSPSAVRSLFGSGRIALLLGMENGAAIGDDLDGLRHFFDRGVRYVTLTHAKDNQICDSSYEETHTWGGLSPFGREVVAEMNRLGVMIDVSHITDEAFLQVVELSAAPVIASHSSCRRFTPGWERNMSDEMILALARGGGVIQVNFGSAFLTAEANKSNRDLWDQIEHFRGERGLGLQDPEVKEFSERLFRQNPPVLADVAHVADHIDHVVGLVGVEHVGIGSDFDGVGPTTPTGLEDVSAYPNLIRVLLERGYGDAEIEMIFGGNLLRVWSEVERVAAER